MDNDVRKRLRWVQLFEELKNCTQVCLKCGISRATLRKWLERDQESGLNGLVAGSGGPRTSPDPRVSDRERQGIVELRPRGWGWRGTQGGLSDRMTSMYRDQLSRRC